MVGLGELCRADEVNSVSHSPCWNAWMRARQSGLDKVRVPGARCKSIRGRRIHHAESASVSASAIRSNAKRRAARNRPPKKRGWCLELTRFAAEGGKQIDGIQALQRLAHVRI